MFIWDQEQQFNKKPEEKNLVTLSRSCLCKIVHTGRLVDLYMYVCMQILMCGLRANMCTVSSIPHTAHFDTILTFKLHRRGEIRTEIFQ